MGVGRVTLWHERSPASLRGERLAIKPSDPNATLQAWTQCPVTWPRSSPDVVFMSLLRSLATSSAVTSLA